MPERDRAGVRRRLRQAWDDPEHGRALGRLEHLADELAHTHPRAAASLREGMAETLTLTRLGVTGPLTRTLASTNPDRVDDRVRAAHQQERQALAIGRDGPSLDRCRDAQGPSASSGGSSATSSSPRWLWRSSAISPRP